MSSKNASEMTIEMATVTESAVGLAKSGATATNTLQACMKDVKNDGMGASRNTAT